MHMFTAALFITVKNQHNSKLLQGMMIKHSIEDPYKWILLSNKKEQCTDPKWIMLSKRSQTLKVMYCMTSIIWHSGKGKTIGQETDLWLPGAGGWGCTNLLQRRTRTSAGVRRWGNSSVSQWFWWFYLCMGLTRLIDLYSNSRKF